MRAFAQKQNQPQQESSANLTRSNRLAPAASQEVHPLLHLQRAIGNQAVLRSLQARADGLEASFDTEDGPTTEVGSETPRTTRFAHDFSRIPVHAPAPITIQPKLAVSTPGDIYEQEADHLADQVMRMPEPQLQRACACGGGCAKCQTEQPSHEHQRLQTKHVGSSDSAQTTAPPIVHEVLASPGQPLDAATRAFFEPRFGQDLSRVRIHTDRKATESARAVKALAYTVGSDIVFGEAEVSPRTLAGQRLLAHELVHTLQQNISAKPAGVVQRQASLDVALRSPAVTALILGSEILDGFELNSHTLTAEHRRRLLALAKRLKQLLREHEMGTVKITGHTDATGDEGLNDQLGQDRADAAAAFLRNAGVPTLALLAESAGESALRVPTDKAEPRNRRVEITFLPELPTSSPPATEPATAEPGKKPVQIPRPENFCSERPEICDPITTKPETMPDCRPTNCSAVSLDSFDKQPPDLQLVLIKSRGTKDDASVWFAGLLSDSRLALTQIFNRLCQYGVWCHTRHVLGVAPAEAPVVIADRLYKVPGSTPSVYFTSPSKDALIEALKATGRFCTAHGAGASQHPKQTTMREISGSDSLHISVGPGDLFDAHVDQFSPTPEPTGDGLCSNAPTPAALRHIHRELVPEIVRKGVRVFGVHIPGPPGLQIDPDSNPPEPAVPPGAVGTEPLPEVVRITLRGPVKERKQEIDVAPLPVDVERLIDVEIPGRIRRNALVPPNAEQQFKAAARAADEAGPGEERSLRAARDAAFERLESFAEDAHYFAQTMARRMDHAARSDRPDFAVQLGPIYGTLTENDRKYVLAQIRDIARIVRALLAERARGVHKMWVAFGESVIWDVDF